MMEKKVLKWALKVVVFVTMLSGAMGLGALNNVAQDWLNEKL